MSVVDLSISKKEQDSIKLEDINNTLREEVLEYAKNFKTSWLHLGRHLYAIWQDKLYYSWNFEKFEDYTEKELGIKKSLCTKLLKTYLFVEQDEPEYLKEGFVENRETLKVPNYDAIDVLRMAKRKKELNVEDYQKLRGDVFERGIEAGAVRKDLASIMKERKPIDPEEERENRNEAAIKKLINAIESFKKDMAVLKMIPDEIVEEVRGIEEKLAGQI
ncbi:hypothetical protein MNBD_UNCLBAC01-1595 [hydrothermal vent metagenome]|uniref:Uncharacterized protein n=1 Tax=hydrothermal vent metagenome TaxID=652676 RepID=A0A3B1D8L7_9ZZZZ